MRRTIMATVAATLALLGSSGPAAADPHTETADILDQGGGAVLVEDGAQLVRTPSSLSAKTKMPTPEPGTYTYPQEGAISGPGHPEAFTLWVFVFNFPDLCDGPCDTGDLGDTSAQGGAFLGAGHLVGGKNLTLSGQVSTQTTPFVGAPLQDPAGAEVHLAVAPHGGLDSSLLPDQTKTPSGPSTVWWTALFEE